MLSVTKIVKFDAAHFLPGYRGKCANLHGHTWKVEIEVSLKDEYDREDRRMVVDFSYLKKVMTEKFLNDFDHSYLNHIMEHPTAENITLYIVDRMGHHCNKLETIQIDRVRVWESEDSYAEWKK